VAEPPDGARHRRNERRRPARWHLPALADCNRSVSPLYARQFPPSASRRWWALSRLVGMICPGLHSILKSYLLDFTEVDWARRPALRGPGGVQAHEPCAYACFGPGIAGEVAAFRRAPPIAQPSMDEIAARVPKGAYAGATVLIVGGSRGLGEVAAKACAARRKQNLHITYAVGRRTPKGLRKKICCHGATCRCTASMCAVMLERSFRIFRRADILYFFASRPLIPRRAGFLMQ